MNTLIRDRRGQIEVLTINRPERRNAIDPELSAAMDTVFEELEHDDEVQVVILTGAGDRSFCAGIDLKAQAEIGSIQPFLSENGFAGITERRFTKVLIAAVNGFALGGGLEITLACDLVVAADTATFGSPEARLGVLADGGTFIRLPHWVPMAIAKEMVFLGRPIDAERAYQVGLINRVVPAAELLPAALAMAEEIVANAPVAVRWSKMAMNDVLNLPESDAWPINADYSRRIENTADFQEGPRAFSEKRKPNFEGR